jgi:hypothetical protein
LTQILAFMEGDNLIRDYNMNFSYRSQENEPVSKQTINTFICPGNPFVYIADPNGFGHSDYFATVYTDIAVNSTEATGFYGGRDKASRVDGALSQPNSQMSAISDGLSNTLMFVEDVGRTHPAANVPAGLGAKWATYSKYADPDCANSTGRGTIDSTDCTATNYSADGKGGGLASGGHAVNRWADPDAVGSGISGPDQDTSAAYTTAKGSTAGFTHFVNQNATPTGGPTTCPWSYNNCGLNDEAFSFHPAGCNSAYADGSTHFLAETIDPLVMRCLVSRAEGITASVPQ